MSFNKVTSGDVVQVFDDNGNCISQEFIAGEVEFENLYIPIESDIVQNAYFPFEMIQPESE